MSKLKTYVVSYAIKGIVTVLVTSCPTAKEAKQRVKDGDSTVLPCDMNIERESWSSMKARIDEVKD